MIFEGERIRELVAAAKREVILCAPFVKAKVLGIIIEAVPQAVPVRIVTRWRPAEVASGLSDLEVYDIAKERLHTELSLLDSLHAKLYLSDDDCLVGSANLTAAALGWRPDSNVEILLRASRSDTDVLHLLERLSYASPATFQIRSEVEEQAAALSAELLDDGLEVSVDAVERLGAPWLPRCAAPDKLFTVYENPQTTAVVEGTRSDALADLSDLEPPIGMDHDAFTSYINAALFRLPSFRWILDSVAARLTDVQGSRLIAELKPDLSQSDLQRQWYIVREWIGVFCQDRFEVAPDSYVVRLKPH
ncbi:MAG: phospholipase D family protein [Rhodospirillaceae bacterium]|nr:phospholipase D family protein [Rhodospirillaceae bacterium]